MSVNGTLEILFIYEAVQPFHQGKAAFKINNQWGYINTKGEIIIDARFEDVPNTEN